MTTSRIFPSFLTACLAIAALPCCVSAGAIVSGSLANTLPSADDSSASPVNIGFSINYFGSLFTTLSVNENGNVTFADTGYSDYSVSSLANTGRPIIAPYFADVSTLGMGSGTITYGNLTVGGRQAFAVDYSNVGYYDSNADKLNSFQVILINRSDTGAGNFDLEFNYDKIQWESGDASGGLFGLGGGSAVAGFSSTGTAAGTTYQFAGSAVNGALIDGGLYSLVAGSLNSGVAGRYDFSFRDGVTGAVPEPSTTACMILGIGILGFAWRRKQGSKV